MYLSRAREIWRKSRPDENSHDRRVFQFVKVQLAMNNVKIYRFSFNLEISGQSYRLRSARSFSAFHRRRWEKNLNSVLTHISYVAVRAVSFGASASFGSARLSVRPPDSRRLRLRSVDPQKAKQSREHQERQGVSFEYLPRDNLGISLGLFASVYTLAVNQPARVPTTTTSS